MTKKTDIQASRMLRSARLYRTGCRVAILKALTGTRRPLTQGQVAQLLGRKRFDKVTIYRTLGKLAKVGLVHRVFMRERAWHFELADNCSESQCHPHFTCVRCGDTRCLMDAAVPMAESPHRGFVIQRQEVRLEGLCPACA